MDSALDENNILTFTFQIKLIKILVLSEIHGFILMSARKNELHLIHVHINTACSMFRNFTHQAI